MSGEIYYRVILQDAGSVGVVCMQEVDEPDYDHDLYLSGKFISKQGAYLEAAILQRLLNNLDPSMDIWGRVQAVTHE